MNLPNSITLTRIFSIPVLIWVLSTSRFTSVNGEKELLASALFIAASITDGIDGYIARKRRQITTMGMLLDPLADKLLIAAAFVTLVQFNPRLVPAWIAVIIIGREFLVSGLRSIAASEGFTIEASDLGKFKMFVQIVSVVAVILDHRWREWPVFRFYIFPVDIVARLAIWFMVALSLISAGDYFIAFWRRIDRHVVKRRRRAFILSRRKKQDAALI
ncbi:MAG TPA: CDP-diacylglycerol--glycerol-3-phosphate 3-phosphatidyltransferase [Terriglobales bacterium]|nr:CDP-diacylglycerol--glycerol-3-phosphate 3-phosphatidyltransferase [Terriglobales bacterium]